jgi:hypothetical protein
VDLPDKDRGCHRTGFTKKCLSLVTKGTCKRWLQIQGKNPNTGEDINRSNCIDDWTPLLLMENSQMQRQTGAAVESFRNEMVQANGTNVEVMQAAFAIAANGRASNPKPIKQIGAQRAE